MTVTTPYVGHERGAETECWESIVTWRTLISADRTPTAGMTVGVAEIEPGSTEVGALHHHEADEIYYVVTGRGEVHLDGVDHAIEAGSVVFVPGGTHHFVRNTGDETLKLLYVFAVDRFSDVEYVFPASPVVPPN
jgi:mannose-6-phosphate isomerase-like protein (cupin superfamily)